MNENNKKKNNSYREQADSYLLGMWREWDKAKGRNEEAQTTVHKTNKPQDT